MTPFEIFVVLFTHCFLPFCGILAFTAVFEWVWNLLADWGHKK